MNNNISSGTGGVRRRIGRALRSARLLGRSGRVVPVVLPPPNPPLPRETFTPPNTPPSLEAQAINDRVFNTIDDAFDYGLDEDTSFDLGSRVLRSLAGEQDDPSPFPRDASARRSRTMTERTRRSDTGGPLGRKFQKKVQREMERRERQMMAREDRQRHQRRK